MKFKILDFSKNLEGRLRFVFRWLKHTFGREDEDGDHKNSAQQQGLFGITFKCADCNVGTIFDRDYQQLILSEQRKQKADEKIDEICIEIDLYFNLIIFSGFSLKTLFSPLI